MKRRDVLGSIAAVASVNAIGEIPTPADDELSFPSPRIIYDPTGNRGAIEKIEESEAETTIRFDGFDNTTLYQRIWDTKTGSTETVIEHPVPPSSSSYTIRNRAHVSESTISMVYAQSDDGEFEYLFDLVAPRPLQADILDSLPGIPRIDKAEGTSPLARDYRGDGVNLTLNDWGLFETDLSITIPYSLYTTRKSNEPTTMTDILPSSSADVYSPYTHEALEWTLKSAARRYSTEYFSKAEKFGLVDFVSTVIQSIPSVDDLESTGQLNYLRSPEEALVENRTDCKDASVMLYNILDSMGFDPVFIAIFSELFESGQRGEGAKGKEGNMAIPREEMQPKQLNSPDLFRNHLAVGIPKRQLEPIPSGIKAKLFPLRHGNEQLLYVESTSPSVPGEFPAGFRSDRYVTYSNYRDILTNLFQSP